MSETRHLMPPRLTRPTDTRTRETWRWAHRQLASCVEHIAAATGADWGLAIASGQPACILSSTEPLDRWPLYEPMAQALAEYARGLSGPVVMERPVEASGQRTAELASVWPAGLAAVLVAPLWRRDEYVGALGLGGAGQDRLLRSGALQTIHAAGPALAAAVGLALDYERLSQRHGRYRRRVHLLHEAGLQLIERFALGVVGFDRTLRVRWANATARQTYHLSAGSPLAAFLEGLGIESHLEPWTSRLRQTVEQGLPWDVERAQGREGQSCTVLRLSARPVRDAQGGLTQGLLIIEDTTRQMDLEKRIEVSERLAAVGKLAARVAHELNNPLDGILRYVNMAARVCESGGPTDKVIGYLSECRTGLLRMADLVRALLDFSRSTQMAAEAVDINRLLEQALRCMFGPAHEGRIEIVRDYAAGLPARTPGSLFQVFCNLIKNALDAMKDQPHGVLTLCTKRRADRQVVEISDTGPGLPPGDPEDLFKPFFTTKGPGAGTGLGLPISRDIVARLGGTLVGASRPSGGAVFSVDLPLEFP